MGLGIRALTGRSVTPKTDRTDVQISYSQIRKNPSSLNINTPPVGQMSMSQTIQFLGCTKTSKDDSICDSCSQSRGRYHQSCRAVQSPNDLYYREIHRSSTNTGFGQNMRWGTLVILWFRLVETTRPLVSDTLREGGDVPTWQIRGTGLVLRTLEAG